MTVPPPSLPTVSDPGGDAAKQVPAARAPNQTPSASPGIRIALSPLTSAGPPTKAPGMTTSEELRVLTFLHHHGTASIAVLARTCLRGLPVLWVGRVVS